MGYCVGVALLLVTNIFATKPTWQIKPDIVVCSDSRVSNLRIDKATEFWKALNHDFGTVTRVSRDNMACVTGEPDYGTIMIDIPSQNFDFSSHLGTTKTWWRTDTGEIFKAKIEIKIGWENKPRVLEHELGHALGFKDNNTTGHLMNHEWARGGYKKKGLQREQAD
ncbi:MAG TPA: hypothetical protein DCM40_08845 [Maribacter sp.]|nr:hypothetical protein [Maribacter sp.]